METKMDKSITFVEDTGARVTVFKERGRYIEVKEYSTTASTKRYASKEDLISMGIPEEIIKALDEDNKREEVGKELEGTFEAMLNEIMECLKNSDELIRMAEGQNRKDRNYIPDVIFEKTVERRKAYDYCYRLVATRIKEFNSRKGRDV